MDERIRVSNVFPLEITDDEHRSTVLSEIQALDRSLNVQKLLEPSEDLEPILILKIERKAGGVLVTLDQDRYSPLTVVQQVVLLLGSFAIGTWGTWWIALPLFIAIHIGNYIGSKRAPFAEEQLARALENARLRACAMINSKVIPAPAVDALSDLGGELASWADERRDLRSTARNGEIRNPVAKL